MKRSEFIEEAYRRADAAGRIDDELVINFYLNMFLDLGMKPPCSCYDDPERTEEKGYGPRCGISWHLNEWSAE